MTAPLLSVEDLVVHYATEAGLVRAVDGVSLSIERGDTLALVGESGSGKSTVARAILGLVSPTRGAIRFEGTVLPPLGAAARRPYLKRIQMVFQDPDSSLNPRLSVATSIAEPLDVHERLPPEARARRVATLMESVGLDPGLGSRHPHELSGGQKQRVCIARALSLEPELLVCDEAISALDVSVQAQILNLLAELREAHGLSYLFITHDLRVVSHLASHVAVLHQGRLVETADAGQLFASPRHEYTRALLGAVPRVPS